MISKKDLDILKSEIKSVTCTCQIHDNRITNLCSKHFKRAKELEMSKAEIQIKNRKNRKPIINQQYQKFFLWNKDGSLK